MAIGIDRTKLIQKCKMLVSKTFVGIMHTNRLDLLETAIQSVKHIDGDIVVLNNSAECEIVPPIRDEETWGQSLRYIAKTVVNPVQPLTYSQSMNYFRQIAIHNNIPYYFVMHEDAEALDGVIKMLQEKARVLTMHKKKWGIIFTNEDSLIAVNTDLVQEQKWDTALPAYFADTDFYYWAKQRGYELIESKLPVNHIKSTTINSDTVLRYKNNVTYNLYEQYYMMKAGGNKGNEKFQTPFNNGDLFKLNLYNNG